MKTKEAEFGRCLESFLEPAIERNEQRYKDVDYDIVSGDGLIGTAASLQSLPSYKSATFLRVFSLLEFLMYLIYFFDLDADCCRRICIKLRYMMEFRQSL